MKKTVIITSILGCVLALSACASVENSKEPVSPVGEVTAQPTLKPVPQPSSSATATR